MNVATSIQKNAIRILFAVRAANDWLPRLIAEVRTLRALSREPIIQDVLLAQTNVNCRCDDSSRMVCASCAARHALRRIGKVAQ